MNDSIEASDKHRYKPVVDESTDPVAGMILRIGNCATTRGMARTIFFLLICGAAFTATVACAANAFVPDERLVRRLSADNPYRIEGARATFVRDGHAWTIVGAGQPPSQKWSRRDTWNQPEALELFEIENPITNTTILPFSGSTAGMRKLVNLTLTAARAEYEPASILIRTGADSLARVAVTPTDLECAEDSLLPADRVDVRLVVPWFQAGHEVNNSRPQTKELVSELLVRDQDLVHVDYVAQVNIIRDYTRVVDADVLLPFKVPAYGNQQIWITFNVPDTISPGRCNGSLVFAAQTGNGRKISRVVPVSVTVIGGELPAPPTMHALYYVGGKENVTPRTSIQDVNAKALSLIELDFADMKAHGNTNVILMHDYDATGRGDTRNRALEPLFEAVRKARFRDNMLLYRDRTNFAMKSTTGYRQKLERIIALAKSSRFAEVGMFHMDEARLDDLLKHRKSFEMTHEVGVRNITTIRPEFAESLAGLLDIGIIHRNRAVGPLIEHGIVPWAYNNPQAGKEVPGDVRWLYGFGLWLDGFSGACGFAYQAARHAWDDWGTPTFRAHLMTYPSLRGPIPTLQWEAWREGIDDLRYLRMAAEKVRPEVQLMEMDDRAAFLDTLVGPVARSANPTLIRQALISTITR